MVKRLAIAGIVLGLLLMVLLIAFALPEGASGTAQGQVIGGSCRFRRLA